MLACRANLCNETSQQQRSPQLAPVQNGKMGAQPTSNKTAMGGKIFLGFHVVGEPNNSFSKFLFKFIGMLCLTRATNMPEFLFEFLTEFVGMLCLTRATNMPELLFEFLFDFMWREDAWPIAAEAI